MFKQNGHDMYDGIHDTGLIHKDDNRLCKANSKSGCKNTNGALAEKLAGVAWFQAKNNCQQNSHNDIDCSNLWETPAKTDTAKALYDDNTNKNKDTQHAGQGHFFHVSNMVFFLLCHIFLLHQTSGRVLFYFPTVCIEAEKTNQIKNQQSDGSKANTGKKRKANDLLCHSGCKGVH